MRWDLILTGVATTFAAMLLIVFTAGTLPAVLCGVGMFGVFMTCVGAEASTTESEASHG